jgi:restriction system protein
MVGLVESTRLRACSSGGSPHFSASPLVTKLGSKSKPGGEPLVTALAAEVEDQLAFQMEKQLEDFLVHNWRSTELGRDYDIYEEDGEVKGQQYPSDTGPMDILAISKDGKRLLVAELKRERASDAVVGQIQRYMGYVQEELLEPGQPVEGVIIAPGKDDLRIRRTLSIAQNIRFIKYRVEFHLESPNPN